MSFFWRRHGLLGTRKRLQLFSILLEQLSLMADGWWLMAGTKLHSHIQLQLLHVFSDFTHWTWHLCTSKFILNHNGNIGNNVTIKVSALDEFIAPYPGPTLFNISHEGYVPSTIMTHTKMTAGSWSCCAQRASRGSGYHSTNDISDSNFNDEERVE